MEKNKSPITDLVKALLADPDYWTTWKANIAMQFQDAFARDYRTKGIHEISNDAAQEFLLLLVQNSTANSEKEKSDGPT